MAGTVSLAEVAVLPIAGILIGGAMTATSLAGRRALDELVRLRCWPSRRSRSR